ncbi:unnamed protein product [Nezara viridula]|uniref:Uncharacterized protein n=1 Tax=Nezara viridula TaxID=85310 RepID=A0A9P0MM12_NEZVI|nr:unnamed protein product [Nezara viridula]
MTHPTDSCSVLGELEGDHSPPVIAAERSRWDWSLLQQSLQHARGTHRHNRHLSDPLARRLDIDSHQRRWPGRTSPK